MTRLRGLLPHLLLIGLGTLLGLGALEVGARVAAMRQERAEGRISRDLGRLAGPASRSAVTLGQIIRRSPNPRMVYELRPRLDVTFSGGRLTTSDAGHRGSDVVSPKPTGAFRIVGIGDSYMFGQGVSDDATYMARLPGLLPEVAGRRVETVNLGIPGYNTVMEVEMLRARVAVLEPDLVLLEIVGNDLDLPNFLWKETDPWTLRRSFLLEFVRGRLTPNMSEAGSVEGLTEAPREGHSAPGFVRDDHRIPDAYRSMVGIAAFERAVSDLTRLCRERGIKVLALTHGVWFEEQMLNALRANEVPILVLRTALRKRAKALGAPDYARSPLALSPADLHPSALGHSAIAEELAAWLRATLGS